MLWIPITAAGIVNGIGHWWGYRNFEAPDASPNVSPWGIVIGGEELHNNHHTYPTSAKLSVKRYEFDIGWVYIRGLEMLGLATVRKTAPQLKLGAIKPVADGKTLEAIIANRYEVMANYARSLRHASRAEIARLKGEGAASRARSPSCAGAPLAAPRRRQDPARAEARRSPSAWRTSPYLAKLVAMREELRHALDPHQRLRRAARRRPAGLAAQGRGERHRRPAGVRPAPARRCTRRDAATPNKKGRLRDPLHLAETKGSRSDPAEGSANRLSYFSFVSL